MFVPKGDPPGQWEANFFTVLQEKEELKRKVVKLSNDLRNVKAKSTRFENTIRQRDRLDKEDSYSTNTRRPRKFDRDEEDFIEDLKERNFTLQQENRKLEEKLGTVIHVLKKYKQQVQTLKLRHDSGTHVRQRGGRGNGPKVGVSDTSDQFESDVKSVMGQLQQRLVQAEEELRTLEKENKQLKIINEEESRSDKELKKIHEESRSDISTFPSTFKSVNHDLSVSNCYIPCFCSHLRLLTYGIHMQTSYPRINEELQEARVQIKLLEVKYAKLETQSQSQMELQQETRKKLKECNDHIRKLREEIHILRKEKKEIFKEARMAEEHRDQVEELMDQNKFLEEKFKKLCELPFEEEEQSSTEEHLKQHILDVESQNTSLKDEITGLREINKEQTKLNQVSQDLMKKWKQNFQEVEHEVEDCIKTRGKMYFDLTALQEKNVEHGSDKGVQFNGTEVDSVSVQTEPTQPETPEKDQGSKKVLSVVQLRKMLDEQVARNKKLQTEVDVVKNEETQTVNKIVSKFDELQLLASQKLDQIRRMDQQEKHDEKLGRREYILSDSDSSESSPEEMTLVLSLQNAHLSEHIFTRSNKTMITIDLLDYETKCSPVGVGHMPNFDFSNKYKLLLNPYILEQLDQDKASVEICLYAVSPETKLVANAFVSLKQLMENANQNFQIGLSALNRNRDQIGSICVNTLLLDRSVSENERIRRSYDDKTSGGTENLQPSNSNLSFDDPYTLATHPTLKKKQSFKRPTTYQTIPTHNINVSRGSPDPFMTTSNSMPVNQGTTRGYNDYFSNKMSTPNTTDSIKENISVASADPYVFAAHSKSADDNTFTYKSTESRSKTALKSDNVVDDASSLDSFYYM